MPLPPDPQDDEVRPPGEGEEADGETEGGDDPVGVAATPARNDAASTGDSAGDDEGGVDLGPIDRPPPAPGPPATIPFRPPRSPAYNTPKAAAYTGAPVPAPFARTASLAAATTTTTTTTVPATVAPDRDGTDEPTTVLGPRRDHSRLRWTLAAVVALVVGAGVAVAISGGEGTGTGTGTGAGPTTVPADDVASGDTDAAGAAVPGTISPTTTAPATGPGSPVAAMEDYLDAIRKRDCSTMVSMVTVASLPAGPDPRRAAIDACEEGFTTGSTGLNGATFGKVRLVSQTTDRAIVSFEQTVDSTTSSQTIVLRYRRGRWLLALSG